MKFFLSIIGDMKASTYAFFHMIRTPDGPRDFISSSINVAQQYGFHGLDLYWKYPGTKNRFDMPYLWLLFKEWHDSLIKESSDFGKPQLFLSAIVYFAPKFFPPSDDTIQSH